MMNLIALKLGIVASPTPAADKADAVPPTPGTTGPPKTVQILGSPDPATQLDQVSEASGAVSSPGCQPNDVGPSTSVGTSSTLETLIKIRQSPTGMVNANVGTTDIGRAGQPIRADAMPVDRSEVGPPAAPPPTNHNLLHNGDCPQDKPIVFLGCLDHPNQI